jgi:hypothetical protein
MSSGNQYGVVEMKAIHRHHDGLFTAFLQGFHQGFGKSRLAGAWRTCEGSYESRRITGQQLQAIRQRSGSSCVF